MTNDLGAAPSHAAAGQIVNAWDYSAAFLFPFGVPETKGRAPDTLPSSDRASVATPSDT
jgi:hypothetical protein